jgi:TRAP-type mannitol/chloroaromatic compound transport system permease large subunit
VLAPALNVVGNEVSSVGSSVTATSGDLGQALPVSSVLQVVGSVATSAVNNLGGGSPPVILAGALK